MHYWWLRCVLYFLQNASDCSSRVRNTRSWWKWPSTSIISILIPELVWEIAYQLNDRTFLLLSRAMDNNGKCVPKGAILSGVSSGIQTRTCDLDVDRIYLAIYQLEHEISNHCSTLSGMGTVYWKRQELKRGNCKYQFYACLFCLYCLLYHFTANKRRHSNVGSFKIQL